jgi:glyoxylase-like metal-dependent hydrolase (beta-lactamase superfamily II)
VQTRHEQVGVRLAAVEIAPGVHRIGPSTNGYTKGGYSQAYLFDDGESLTLVDTLWDDDAHVILKYLWEIGRSPNELTHIALTHGHRSHLGGLATLKSVAPDAVVHAHAWEAGIINGGRSAQAIPLRPLIPLKLVPFRILATLGIPKHVPCAIDREFSGDGTEMVGPLEVIPTPGHTPGSVSFYWRERGALALGDAVATWPEFDAGWPGFNLDEALYQQSLRKLIALEPKVVCPGHGDPITEHTTHRIESLLKGPYWPVTATA